jgi:hypothetical protein
MNYCQQVDTQNQRSCGARAEFQCLNCSGEFCYGHAVSGDRSHWNPPDELETAVAWVGYMSLPLNHICYWCRIRAGQAEVDRYRTEIEPTLPADPFRRCLDLLCHDYVSSETFAPLKGLDIGREWAELAHALKIPFGQNLNSVREARSFQPGSTGWVFPNMYHLPSPDLVNDFDSDPPSGPLMDVVITASGEADYSDMTMIVMMAEWAAQAQERNCASAWRLRKEYWQALWFHRSPL